MKLLILLFSLCIFASAVCAQDEECPSLTPSMKQRLQVEGAGWLADKPLQKRIAEQSRIFGMLVRHQQCVWTQAFLEDKGWSYTVFLEVDGHLFEAMYRRYRDRWVMAVKPYGVGGEMPDANILEINGQKWTLIHRDTDGSMRVLAAYYY
jgi:hypothetical protein